TLSFFVPCAGAPPHLHSFPTRRSSDLLPELRVAREHELVVRESHPFRLRQDVVVGEREVQTGEHRVDVEHDKPDDPRRQERQDRSEEHTSELQSLAYLVCRLLLEKKKK